ncbi:hypothetical protein H2200_008445 [Cladophialophora chaetospira]|uniref:Glutathione S-transferase n=1 Tax=Cladophialophora chaetospira TaxID=386627 RepID=A0AA38X5V2_9EURO|nr:hypothetical protein H2200_008445 [Cladophialophora chaetospira]
MSFQANPKLKLWYTPIACSFAPHALLLEAGLDFQMIPLELGKYTAEFMTLNPKGRVPVLAMDDEVITEMPAILTAISSLVPERQLMGRTTLETIRAYEWINYLSGTLHGQGYGARFRPDRYIHDPALHPQVRQRGLETIKECFAFIESKLREAGTAYLVGDGFTAVDPFLFVLYRWGVQEKLDMHSDYPYLEAWANRLLERKCVVDALKVHNKV